DRGAPARPPAAGGAADAARPSRAPPRRALPAPAHLSLDACRGAPTAEPTMTTRGSRRIHDARVRPLNDHPPRRGRYVLYWMQQSQRAAGNHALEFAVQRANALGLPLRVGFGLTDDYPEAAERHYRFMLEGVRQTARERAARGIPLVARRGAPDAVALALAGDATELVCDRGYLRHQKRWRQNVAAEAACPVVQVEADVVVPTAVASRKAEWAARTLRRRINARLDECLVGLRPTPLARRGGAAAARGLDLA